MRKFTSYKDGFNEVHGNKMTLKEDGNGYGFAKLPNTKLQ
jgi:hypothetical protein